MKKEEEDVLIKKNLFTDEFKFYLHIYLSHLLLPYFIFLLLYPIYSE